LIEIDGVAMCVHHRRLKTDGPVPPSAAPVTKDEENKEEHPATQVVEDNDLVVDVAKDEDEKKADPSAQEVENNDLMVDAAKHEEKKEAGPAVQKVHENDFVVGADPGKQISSPSQHRSVRKMVLTATYVRKTCAF
jgi:RNA polymerase-binding transcription factor DksA